MKTGYLVFLFLTICFYSMIGHTESKPVEYLQHIVVNNNVEKDAGQWTQTIYELTGPSGVIAKGTMYPGTKNYQLDYTTFPNLAGIYILRYHVCYGSVLWPECRAYSGSITITHNAEIIWELSLEGLNVTELEV